LHIQNAIQKSILVEHDSSLFDGAEEMLDPVSGALKDAGRDSLVILYTPVIDRTFYFLILRADRIIEIAPIDKLSMRVRSVASACGETAIRS
jgi:hypothetical protein